MDVPEKFLCLVSSLKEPDNTVPPTLESNSRTGRANVRHSWGAPISLWGPPLTKESPCGAVQKHDARKVTANSFQGAHLEEGQVRLADLQPIENLQQQQ